MRIAIPCAGGKLCGHFGHCEEFMFFDVNKDERKIEATEKAVPPPHEQGVLPRWMGEREVDLVIAGGLGEKARAILEDQGIHIVMGAPEEDPREIVQAYLEGNLQVRENSCHHDHHEHHHCH